MNKGTTDFQKSCRVCFNPVDENLPISLLETVTVNDLSVTVSNALEEIYPFFLLEITKRDDCLPRNICLECLNNLKTSYGFRKTCEISNQKVLQILNEHDRLGKENIQHSKHYQYNITKCQYFNDLLIKDESVQHFLDFDGTEQVDENPDFKKEIEEKHIDVKLDNAAIRIEKGIFKEESSFTKQESVTDDKFECQNRCKAFRSLSRYRNHKKSHESKFQCDLCTKKFSTGHALELHKRRHTSASNFTHLCPECGKKFLTSAELIRHRRTHVNIKLYQCNVCLKKFTQCYSLKLHKMRHNGYRPNVCEICDKRFTTIGNLKEHKIIHMTEKPHKCKICAKTWITSSDLKKHMRTHSGEKPYRCQYCERNFARKETVKVHERIHTGEKPYSCNFCNKQFVHLSSLDRHSKSCDLRKVESLLNL